MEEVEGGLERGRQDNEGINDDLEPAEVRKGEKEDDEKDGEREEAAETETEREGSEGRMCCTVSFPRSTLVLPFQLCWSRRSVCDVCLMCSPVAIEMEGTECAGRRGAGSRRERCCRTLIMASFSSS